MYDFKHRCTEADIAEASDHFISWKKKRSGCNQSFFLHFVFRKNLTPLPPDMDTLKRPHLFLFPLLVLLSSLLHGCSAKKEKQLGLLPSAKGEKAEIILVMDSVQWKGSLGEEVRTVFTAETPGLTQPEPLFTLRFIQPFAFQNILRQHKNVVLIATFDSNTSGSRKMQSYFTPESQERIKSEEDLYMLVEEDEYAMGQIVIYLLGKMSRPSPKTCKPTATKSGT